MKIILKKFHLFIIASTILACSQSNRNPSYFIEPPLGSVSKSFDQFELNPNEPKVLRLKNGSSIVVPANAFVDKNGNPVTGTVSLKYREFHNAADILTSGIPMNTTDETGKVQHLESGGMFELNASSNGQEIKIADNKKIRVALASFVEGDFDFYYLEEQPQQENATASFITEARANRAPAKQYSWKKLFSPSDSIKKAEDGLKKGSVKYFKLNFDTKKYPETASLDTIKWVYAGNKIGEDPTAPVNKLEQKGLWTNLTLSQPKYKSKIQKEFIQSKNGIVLAMLGDSSGYIITTTTTKNNGAVLYGWDGVAKATYADIPESGGGHLITEVSPTSKYVIFYNVYSKKPVIKIYTKQGVLIYSDYDFLSYSRDVCFLHDEDRIIYSDSAHKNLKIINLQIKKVQALLPYSKYNSDHNYIHRTDHKNILVKDEHKLIIYDNDGKKLSSTILPEALKEYDFQYATNSDYILFYPITPYLSLSIKIWDWRKNKIYESGNLSNELVFDSNINEEAKSFLYTSSFHPTEPLLIAYNKSTPVLWNFEKGTKIRLPKYKNRRFYFSEFGNFISTNKYFFSSNGNAALLNKSGTLIIESTDSNIRYNFSKDEKLILINTDNEIILKQADGKTLRKFKDFDSTMSFVWFTNQNTIFSNSKDGMVYLWNDKGELLKFTSTPIPGRYFIPSDNERNVFYSWTKKKVPTVYNFQSELLYAFDNGASSFEGGLFFNFLSTGLFTHPNKNTLRHWVRTEEKLEQGTYLMNVENATADFQTYVRLTPAQVALAKQCNKVIKGREKEEEKRVEKEDALVRSFEINRFGIYNWDRFYKDSNVLLVDASFDFDTVGIDFNSITVFLITGKDKTAVVKYPKENWSRFSFNPNDPNILIAILPGMKIGILEEEYFHSLNIEKIKKEGAHTFKMKILTEQASEETLNTILKKPS